MATLKVCRRYITLVELILVLAIIGAIAGIVGINVNKAMRQQRFQTEALAIVKQLRLAQNLMIILNADAKVKFAKSPKEGTYSYWMELKCPLESSWEKELLKRANPLKEIIDISLITSVKSPLEVDFYSSGAAMTKGTLQLVSRSGERRYIHLSGHPAPILVTDSLERAPATNMAHELQALALQMRQEITAKMPEKKPKSSQVEPPQTNTKPDNPAPQ